MPITAITIENFKGIGEPIRVDLKPITLLFGPNSSGKSTIIHALHYAHEVFERLNLDPGKTLLGGESIDLGGFGSLVHDHDLTKPIVIRFDLDLQNEDLPRYEEGYEEYTVFQDIEVMPGEGLLQSIPRVQTAWVEISVKWSQMQNRPILNSYTVGLNEVEFSTIATSDDSRQIYFSKIDPIHPIFLEDVNRKEAKGILLELFTATEGDVGDFDKLGPMLPALWDVFDFEGGVPGFTKNLYLFGQKTALPRWEHPLVFYPGLLGSESDWKLEASFVIALSSMVVGPGEILRDSLRNLLYLGPIREIPSRAYEPARSPDESRWASGIAAWDVLHRAERSFVDKANEWLARKDRLNSGYSIETKEFKELEVDNPLILALVERRVLDEEDSIEALKKIPTKRRLILQEEASGIEVLPQDVGVGISQVVPVIVAALHAKTGVVAIEQSELHIHPAFQVALGDLFISQVNEKDVAFLLETHSEHLMLRFLRRIRETSEDTLPPGKAPLKPGDLAVYYVEQGEQGITLTSIRINEDGDFVDRWPKGFFSERMEELF